MRKFTPILISCVAVSLGCTDTEPKSATAPLPPQHLIMDGGDATSDGFSISNGNVVVIENEPGIAFATLSAPGQPRRVAYFVVFNHDGPTADVKTRGGIDGARANSLHTISTYGKECTVNFDVVLTKGTHVIESETISIDGQAYDSSKGRVFLVDMKPGPPTITQVSLDLPADVPILKGTEATEQFGHDTLKAFRARNEDVEEFCRLTEAKDK